MSYITLPEFDETGYVVLDSYDQSRDPQEWLDITYVDWKSSGDTRFAPLASAYGDMECNGFWNHTPPKTDKDGVWVADNVARAPRLKARAEEPGANIGRCRVIELQPNSYADSSTTCIATTTTGSTPRAPAGSCAVLQPHRQPGLDDDPARGPDDPSTETRIALPAGAQVIIDTQRLWHAVWHPGAEPRYCLITSWESGPRLGAYIQARHPRRRVDEPAARPAVRRRRPTPTVAQRFAERAARQGAVLTEVKSEA